MDKPRHRVPAARFDGYAEALLREQPQQSYMQNSPLRSLGLLGYGNYGIAEYISLYLGNALAARVIDLVADDCTAKGFTFDNDKDEALEAEFHRLNVKSALASGTRWAELLGASALIVYCDDNADMATELNENNIGQITQFRPVDLTTISRTGLIELDTTKPWYGTTATYNVQPVYSGMPQIVHITRIIPLAGADLPDFFKRAALVPWSGRSALTGCFDEILRYDRSSQWTEKMLERKQQLVYMMEGLGKWLEETRDDVTGVSIGQTRVQERIQLMDTVRSVLNTMVIDGGEVDETGRTLAGGDKITGIDLNMANVPQMFGIYQMNLASKSGYPVTTLFGKSASGLVATNDGDNEGYYNKVMGVQHRIRPALSRIVGLIRAQKSVTIPDDVTVGFAPLWVASITDQANANSANGQANLNNAQAAAMSIQAGIIGPQEAAEWYAKEGLFGITVDQITSMLDKIASDKEQALIDAQQGTQLDNTPPDPANPNPA